MEQGKASERFRWEKASERLSGRVLLILRAEKESGPDFQKLTSDVKMSDSVV